MPNDISDTTGEEYYSGSYKDIEKIVSVLEVGRGKLSTVTMEDVNYYQEMVDREIDDVVGELYHVPLRAMNQCQPDGTTKRVFPGGIRRLARYWTAGLLLLNEFQGLTQNTTDQAQGYIDTSRRELFRAIRFNQRLLGQELKSNISRTMPPSMQPPDLPEANF
jgi:hypothetical protein